MCWTFYPPPNNALQTDVSKASRLLLAQKPRQLAFAAELGRYATNVEVRTMKRIITGVLSLGLTIPANAQELTPQQAGRYMAAAGEVLSAQKTMEGIAKVCGEDAAQLSTVWNDRNKTAIAQAEKLRNTVLRDIEKLKSAQAAKTFEENQNRLLAEKVAKFIREVEDLPPAKKERICGRYVETVSQGQWDIRKSSGLYNFLMNAK